MDCAIWLNRRKIFCAGEIAENFDIAAIRGYFLGGSLIKWLNANGGENYAEALSLLDENAPDLNDRLTEIFTGKRCNAPVHKADERLIAAVDILKNKQLPCSFSGSFPFDFGSFGSFMGYFGSYNSDSFRFGSFFGGSYSWEWEWEWLFRLFGYGSFNFGSYNFSSFLAAFSAGSFNFGSFAAAFSAGSFNFGSFANAFGSYRLLPSGYSFGSYNGLPFNGSYRMISSDEYDEIMYRCLNMCPLNRFGYGIHLI